MLSFRLAAVSAILTFAVACGGSSYEAPTSPESPSPAPAPAPGGPSASVAILVGAEALANRAYSPDPLDVAVGTTVTWRNTDRESHTSTSDAAGWNSGIVGPGRDFSVTLQTAGTFQYHCDIHPGMVGTVVVR
ncbi:MAG TPA: plastocyanin/azurin family copper-binding protein [Vicinamibacterales bacterium]|nr:plastocyanin/azurin family copper-binding protein [Vicinamibacterales bacterium]